MTLEKIMRKLELQTTINIYGNPDELPSTIRALMEHAHEMAKKAYAPYSGFQVGASVLISNGQYCGGNNFENAAYPMCLCGERAALANARAQHPDHRIEAIAIYVMGGNQVILEPAAPCGACRQVLCETEDLQEAPIRIYLQGAGPEVYEAPSAHSMLPLAFTGAFLHR